jgi:hypothetical protein
MTTLSRRALVAGSAICVIPLPALTAVSPDPIYDVISRARAAELPFLGDENPDPVAALEQLNGAREALARTVPTTPAGLGALTGFLREAQANLHGAAPYFESADDAAAFAHSSIRPCAVWPG